MDKDKQAEEKGQRLQAIADLYTLDNGRGPPSWAAKPIIPLTSSRQSAQNGRIEVLLGAKGPNPITVESGPFSVGLEAPRLGLACLAIGGRLDARCLRHRRVGRLQSACLPAACSLPVCLQFVVFGAKKLNPIEDFTSPR